MKPVKIIVILLIVYVGFVAAFESIMGIVQPTVGSVLVISTTDSDGVASDRVLSRLESDGKIYVAANHWPRAWYKQALAQPKVNVTIDDVKSAYLAVPISGEEHDRVQRDNDTGLIFRIMTGFPPRYFLRLDPEAAKPG